MVGVVLGSRAYRRHEKCSMAALRGIRTITFMRIRDLNHLGKTGSFAAVHLTIAIALGYLLTGSFVLAGLITLVEPALNTLAHALFDGWWVRRYGNGPALGKTLAFSAIHFTNAVAVAWAVTGSLTIAGALALIEPMANGVALLVFDRWWSRPVRNAARPMATTQAS
jgi:uncharacterized membrane protein